MTGRYEVVREATMNVVLIVSSSQMEEH